MMASKSVGKMSLAPEPFPSEPFDLSPRVAVDDVPLLLALHSPRTDYHDVIFADPKALSNFARDAAYANMAILASYPDSIKTNHLLNGAKNLTAPWDAQSFHFFFRAFLSVSSWH
jgi:hypothetical protein